MFKVHGFLDDKMVIRQRMEHLPRCGDTVRLSGERYAKVAEVIWCMDEQNDTPSFEGQRINLRMETLTDPPPNVRNERPEASAACGGSRSIDVLGQEATGK